MTVHVERRDRVSLVHGADQEAVREDQKDERTKSPKEWGFGSAFAQGIRPALEARTAGLQGSQNAFQFPWDWVLYGKSFGHKDG